MLKTRWNNQKKGNLLKDKLQVTIDKLACYAAYAAGRLNLDSATDRALRRGLSRRSFSEVESLGEAR